MVGARRWWRKRRAKNRDAVVLCVLSAGFLLAGELLVPVLQEVYSLYIEPVLGDPLLLTVRALLVLFAFTTSLGAFLVMTGGWYFIRHVVQRGRFLVGLGVALWGLHMGLTQGLLASLIADTAPAELRGTAFGMFNLITGIATLFASILAGALWDAVGPQATFVAGALFTALALSGLPVVRRIAP